MRNDSWAWNCSTCRAARTRRRTTSPRGHPGVNLRSLTSLRSGSSSHQQLLPLRDQCCLGRSFPRRSLGRPSLWPNLGGGGGACSLRSSLRRGAGPRSSRHIWSMASCRRRRETRSVWLARPLRTTSGTVSSTQGARMTFLYEASPGSRDVSCWPTYMAGTTGITPRRATLYARYSAADSTGAQRSMMPLS